MFLYYKFQISASWKRRIFMQSAEQRDIKGATVGEWIKRNGIEQQSREVMYFRLTYFVVKGTLNEASFPSSLAHLTTQNKPFHCPQYIIRLSRLQRKPWDSSHSARDRVFRKMGEHEWVTVKFSVTGTLLRSKTEGTRIRYECNWNCQWLQNCPFQFYGPASHQHHYHRLLTVIRLLFTSNSSLWQIVSLYSV
jgi:hypothetical protein